MASIHPAALTAAYGPYVLACGSIRIDTNTTRIAPVDWSDGRGCLPSLHHRLLWVHAGELRVGAAPAAAAAHDDVLFIGAGARLPVRARTPVVALQLLFDALHGSRAVSSKCVPEGLPHQQPSPRTVWGFDPPLRLPAGLAAGARDLMRRIRSRYCISRSDLMRADALLGLWLSDLMRLAAAEPHAGQDVVDPLERILEEATSTHAATIDELADRAGCSPDHFRRLVRRKVGCAPRAWLRRRRLGDAADELARTSDPVAAIASRAGYASAAAFSRAFGQAFATSPLQWRRRRR